jgi:hypothetical protein
VTGIGRRRIHRSPCKGESRLTEPLVASVFSCMTMQALVVQSEISRTYELLSSSVFPQRPRIDIPSPLAYYTPTWKTPAESSL